MFWIGCAGLTKEGPPAAFTSGESVREVLNMDFGWRFSLGHAADMEKDFDYWGGDPAGDAKTGETAGPPHQGFDDSDWEIVDIPHDWAIGVGYDEEAEALHAYMKIGRKYPENCIGWYSKNFEVPDEDLGKRITLEFDGIFRDSRVWLNGHLMWEHESGYTSFGFDISDYVNYVAARCKNEEYPFKVKMENHNAKILPIQEENGWFDKFTGDGVLLFWRLPDEPSPGKKYSDPAYHKKLDKYNCGIKKAKEYDR